MPTCKGLRQELIDCLLVSDCVLKDGRQIKQCLDLDADGVPDKCRLLQRAHSICIKAMVNIIFLIDIYYSLISIDLRTYLVG